MNGDVNISISTEALYEKGKGIKTENKNIAGALEDVNETRALLDGWVSANKDKYDARVANVLPKMFEMVDVIESYGNVAIQTSQRATAVEQKIASAIDDDLFE